MQWVWVEGLGSRKECEIETSGTNINILKWRKVFITVMVNESNEVMADKHVNKRDQWATRSKGGPKVRTAESVGWWRNDADGRVKLFAAENEGKRKVMKLEVRWRETADHSLKCE